MTSAQMPSPLYIPCPFASKTGAAYKAIENASSANVNFEDGFPSAYGAPHGGGGKFITRAEMNAIGRLASQNDFVRACGGVFMFDQNLACKIGGYAKGAVLDFIEGNSFYKVISLVDDNLVDYLGRPPVTVGGVSTIPGSVDGVNWAYCANGEIKDNGVVCKIGDYDGSKSVVQEVLVRCFCATRNGLFGVSGSAAFNQTSPEGSENHYSVSIWIKEGTTDYTSLEGETLDISTDKKIFHTGSSTEGGSQTTKIAKCTKGNWYAVYLTLTYAKIENSTLEVRVD